MEARATTWSIRDRMLTTADHTLIMGILNVTPDSFSDGGRFESIDAAVAHGIEMAEEGADIVDVGGESTRPGAEPVPEADEIDRVVPVVGRLVEQGIVVSVDTTKPAVAAAAVDAGAHIVNDVTALRNPEMARICAETGVGVVLMHMQGDPATMQDDPSYENVLTEVAEFLEERAAAALTHGIEPKGICIDPGIGFGKAFAHNLELLHNVDWLATSGYPVLVGASRKRFLGEILRSAGEETDPDERDPATAATVALAIAGGASVLRVHNVGHAFQAARTADAIVRASLRRL
ncbi:MAG: dihydropteroate synthase [Acidimicrobiia bacterium]|nr:dihydropteroate synthase [Acidimicrobiia bacterium]